MVIYCSTNLVIKNKFKNTAYGIENGNIYNKAAFNKMINSVRKGNYVIYDLDKEIAYPVSKSINSKNFVIIRKNHLKFKEAPKPEKIFKKNYFEDGNIKIILSDFTTKLKPDRSCDTNLCKEILDNINNSKSSIDIAIYGYSSVPEIEKAIKSAIKRGVKVRLVYDDDGRGENIYPDTGKIATLIKNKMSDKNSKEAKYTMHNKFYIFDKKTVITGSANLSHTDMSGFNTNSVIVINSQRVAEIYTQEFEEMFAGKFHSTKLSHENSHHIYFSPQDKGLKKAIIPIIKNAKDYIYIPAFVITENQFTEELINAKKRGIDVKIIVDALNASTKHSKHKDLRGSGIQVKAENWAGKMHSKSIIVDDRFVIIGSMNFSNSGENRNDENFVILENPKAAKFYKEFFLYQWAKIPDKWLRHTPRAEGKESIGSCEDGIDNNYDGYTDKDDEACKF